MDDEPKNESKGVIDPLSAAARTEVNWVRTQLGTIFRIYNSTHSPIASIADLPRTTDVLKLKEQELRSAGKIKPGAIITSSDASIIETAYRNWLNYDSTRQKAALETPPVADPEKDRLDQIIELITNSAPIGLCLSGMPANVISGGSGDFTDYFVNDRFTQTTNLEPVYSTKANVLYQKTNERMSRSTPAWEFVALKPVTNSKKQQLIYGDISSQATDPELASQAAFQLSYTASPTNEQSNLYRAGGRPGQVLNISVILPQSLCELIYDRIKSNPILIRQIAQIVFTKCIDYQTSHTNSPTAKAEWAKYKWESDQPSFSFRPPYEKWSEFLKGKPQMAFCDANQDPAKDLSQIMSGLINIPNDEF